MVAMVERSQYVKEYDDGAGMHVTKAKERAFRQGFLEEARRVAREWIYPVDKTKHDPPGEVERARLLRLRVRERYTVYGAKYGPDCAGRKTYHLGYRPGHEVPAARLRGRHHAMVSVTRAWEEVNDFNRFNKQAMPAWLEAVERWTKRLILPHRICPPPRAGRETGA